MTDKERILIAKAIKSPERVNDLVEAEFSVFSQWGDDGIIQFLTDVVPVKNNYFVEFGVEDYLESNTRFLMMNKNWSGFVMDGSNSHIEKIRKAPYFWKYDLVAKAEFVTVENITPLIKEHCPSEIGLLHIDVDGMDYWIWKELSQEIRPDIVILEFNSVFGPERNITVPYSADFRRHKSHHSGLYAGASLGAMVSQSKERGYAFVGCNSAGNNAYFVKEELRPESLNSISTSAGYRESKFRESRDKSGKLNYLRGLERIQSIRGLEVINTDNNKREHL